MKNFYFILIFALVSMVLNPSMANAKLRILTTTTTLAGIAREVGGDRAAVESLTKGSQEPHSIEAKPSYMVKARDADVLILSGLDLEIGWLSNILQGARNPKIQKGHSGYLEASQFIDPLDVPQGKVDRAEGDIHPFGNPHFQLDPVRVQKVALGIAKRLAEIDPSGKSVYDQNAASFNTKISRDIDRWKKEVTASKVVTVVTYHRSFAYFFDRFGVTSVGELEDKPGIQPSPNHLLDIMKIIREKKVPCILQESFFPPKGAERIHDETGVKVINVATEVDALPGISTYEDLIQKLVDSISECGRKS